MSYKDKKELNAKIIRQFKNSGIRCELGDVDYDAGWFLLVRTRPISSCGYYLKS